MVSDTVIQPVLETVTEGVSVTERDVVLDSVVDGVFVGDKDSVVPTEFDFSANELSDAVTGGV